MADDFSTAEPIEWRVLARKIQDKYSDNEIVTSLSMMTLIKGVL